MQAFQRSITQILSVCPPLCPSLTHLQELAQAQNRVTDNRTNSGVCQSMLLGNLHGANFGRVCGSTFFDDRHSQK